MALFGPRDPRKQRLTFEQILIMAGVILIALQVFGALFGKALGLDYSAGQVYLGALIVLSVLTGFAVMKKLMTTGAGVGKKDIAVLVIIVLGTGLAIVYLPDLVPGIFERSALALKSNLPLP